MPATMGRPLARDTPENLLYTPAQLSSVNVSSDFCQNFYDLVQDVTLPAVLESLKTTGRFYALSWTKETALNPVHFFWDSDAYKTMEACCYYLITHEDPKVEKDLREFVGFVKKAQWADGYINSYYTLNHPEKRFTNLRDMHELYCVGHLAEFAVAYHGLTGSLDLVDVVRRFIVLLHETIIPKGGYPGHEELELALMRIYEVTNDKLFLDTAGYFVRERGKHDENGQTFYDRETIARGLDPMRDVGRGNFGRARDYSYCQAHLPLLEQQEIMGHSVRAVYYLTGALHYSLLTPNESADIRQATARLIDNMIMKKMYITGGLGSVTRYEAFGPEYCLPDTREAGGCYSETCATYGLIILCEKLLREELNGGYGDIMERALFNCFFGALGADGASFYYENPIATEAGKPWHRSRWFEVACCPPNIIKLIGMLPTLMYSSRKNVLAVHLYFTSTYTTTLNDAEFTVSVTSNMPWNGSIKISVEGALGKPIQLALRIPEWAGIGYSSSADGELRNGYLYITAHSGSIISLDLTLVPRVVYAHPNTRKDEIAVMRGPLVYCAENPDNEFELESTYVNDLSLSETGEASISVWTGVPILELEGRLKLGYNSRSSLYSYERPRWEERLRQVKLIPFFLRENRGGNGSMRVWLRQTKVHP